MPRTTHPTSLAVPPTALAGSPTTLDTSPSVVGTLTGRGVAGKLCNAADVLRGARAASLPIVNFVRVRLAGLPGLARIAVHRVRAARAGAVFQVKQVFLNRVLHARNMASESPHNVPTFSATGT